MGIRAPGTVTRLAQTVLVQFETETDPQQVDTDSFITQDADSRFMSPFGPIICVCVLLPLSEFRRYTDTQFFLHLSDAQDGATDGQQGLFSNTGAIFGVVIASFVLALLSACKCNQSEPKDAPSQS